MNSLVIKKYSVILGILLIYALPAYASFEISEIMYDVDGTDTDREWVEVQNTGSSPEDLSKWFFFSGNTKHALVPDTSSMVPAGGYAVIAQKAAKFKLDWPNFTGLIFDSSWTGLNNTGDTIALKDPPLTTVGSVTYTSSMGAGGDGNSLQKTVSGFSAGSPTPGAGPTVSTSVQVSGGGIGSPASTVTLAPAIKKETEAPKINTEIITKNIVIARVPFDISSTTIGYSKELLTKGRFIWNFGDGMMQEDLESKKFSYVYEYPGDYVLTLEYYQNYYNKEPQATDRMVIKVIEGGVTVSSVGTDTDPYIELENNSTYEIAISMWMVKGVTHSFAIPNGTILLPNKKLKLSPHATSFDATDISSIVLQNPAGEIVSQFPKIVQEVKSIHVYQPKDVSVSYSTPVSKVTSKEQATPIDLNTLGAQAAASGIPISNNILAWFGLGGLILVGSLATFFIKNPPKEKDHLEDTLRAEDMTIVE
jgi:hypothetical protein